MITVSCTMGMCFILLRIKREVPFFCLFRQADTDDEIIYRQVTTLRVAVFQNIIDEPGIETIDPIENYMPTPILWVRTYIN